MEEPIIFHSSNVESSSMRLCLLQSS